MLYEYEQSQLFNAMNRFILWVDQAPVDNERFQLLSSTVRIIPLPPFLHSSIPSLTHSQIPINMIKSSIDR